MTWLILLLIGFAVGYVWGKRVGMEDPRRVKVLELFETRTEVSNDDVQKALNVSDATATRYLDALEKSGDIIQIGERGSGVQYRRK